MSTHTRSRKCEGRTKDGRTFDQYLDANPKLKVRFEAILDGFMRECYSMCWLECKYISQMGTHRVVTGKEDCDNRALDEGIESDENSDNSQSTPPPTSFRKVGAEQSQSPSQSQNRNSGKLKRLQPDPSDESSSEGDERDGGDETEKKAHGRKKKGRPVKKARSQRSPPPLTAYEIEKKQNIDRNKKLLAELGLKNAGSSLKNGQKEKGKRKSGKMKEARRAVGESGDESGDESGNESGDESHVKKKQRKSDKKEEMEKKGDESGDESTNGEERCVCSA